jgi:hypothetical protein
MYKPLKVTELPQQLRKLHMHKCHLLTSWRVEPGPLQNAAWLTQLALDKCYASASSLSCLVTMTALQSLSLTGVHVFTGEAQYNISSVLPNLQQLTHLAVGSHSSAGTQPKMFAGLQQPAPTRGNITLGDNFESLSRLTALQELKLGLPIKATALQGISSLLQLSCLLLEGTQIMELSSSSVPGLTALTALQRLQLRRAGVLQPDILYDLRSLRYIELEETQIQGDAQGTAGLLGALTQLQQLSYLFWSQRAGHSWAELPEAYAALTASSTLQELHVRVIGKIALSLTTPCLFQHMFTSRQHHDTVRVLCLGDGQIHQPSSLQHIAQACPALEELYIDFQRPLQDAAQQLEALKALPRLSKLAFGISWSSKAAMAALVQLTQLEELSVALLHPAPDSELSLLAGLTQLARLCWSSTLATHPDWAASCLLALSLWCLRVCCTATCHIPF